MNGEYEIFPKKEGSSKKPFSIIPIKFSFVNRRALYNLIKSRTIFQKLVFGRKNLRVYAIPSRNAREKNANTILFLTFSTNGRDAEEGEEHRNGIVSAGGVRKPRGTGTVTFDLISAPEGSLHGRGRRQRPAPKARTRVCRMTFQRKRAKEIFGRIKITNSARIPKAAGTGKTCFCRQYSPVLTNG